MKIYKLIITVLVLSLVLFACDNGNKNDNNETPNEDTLSKKTLTISDKLAEYAKVELTTNTSNLTDNQKEIIKILMQVSDIIDEIYWEQTWGNKEELLSKFSDPDSIAYLELNYGPWDRLNNNEPINESFGKKPLGANYYPSDIKYLPFISMKFEDKLSQFTLLRRDEMGELYTIPYHKAFETQLQKAHDLMLKASELCENEQFSEFLKLRAEAFLTDDYYKSDMFWMDINDNLIDFIVGPIESDEDRFINTKTAFEAYLLIRDKEWSDKMRVYTKNISDLINSIPVEQKYKDHIIGSVSNIGVYDAIYYKGYANAGGKSISINHPKDGRILKEKGNKKLQFKNVMKAKFDKILYPICEQVFDESQLQNITFDAFFENNLFYEIADGLAINKTINNLNVKDEIKEYYYTLNGLKADVLRLLFITKLHELGSDKQKNLENNYITFVGDIFRSVRFGTSHFQGEGNMITFNFLMEKGTIVKNKETGKYKIDFEKMKPALEELAQTIITILVDGNYDAAKELISEKGFIREELKNDLLKISEAGIPRDVIFEQGPEVLGIN
ncbi:MAG: hypothetical protein Kow0068_00110 [Marinilabiliales bacterium]